jgi:uncharacterized membrane protein YagU involved in acid resistance
MAQSIEYGQPGERTEATQVEMPAPTLWPLLLAFGLLLIFAGLALHSSVSYLGVVIILCSVMGWARNVLPHENHVAIPIDPALRPAPIEVNHAAVMRLKVGEAQHRVRIPEEVHPYSAGVKGGLAGGAAMAALACLYGLIAQHSIVYPVNLLAGVVMPSISNETVEQLRAFDGLAFVAALVGHIVISILVGVLYAVALPMFPKYAALWAGVFMPLIWSAVVSVLMNLLNPPLSEHINWPWFVVSQLGFGLVCGYIIARSTSIRTMQSWTLAERAFMDAPGISRERGRKAE